MQSNTCRPFNLSRLTIMIASVVVWFPGPAAFSASPAEQRVLDLRTELINVANDIDTGVEEILDLIIPLTDTQETGNKVAQMKQSTIDSLRKVIDYYVSERQKIEGELARPAASLTKDQMVSQVEVIDEKVDERIDEIMRISASLAESKDVEKYEHDFNPYTEIYNQRVSDEYKQNQKVQRRVVATRSDLGEGLKKSIQTLKERLNRYERLLSYQVGPANKAAIGKLIEETKGRISQREEQLASLGEIAGDAGTRAIGKSEFQIINQKLNDDKASIRSSFELMRRLKGEYDSALVRYNNSLRMSAP